MTNIAVIHGDRRHLDLSVFELAVASAISRQAINTDDDLKEVLSDWFQRAIVVPDVSAALDSLIARGLVRACEGELCQFNLTAEGIATVSTLYGGCIRMIDRGLGLLSASMILNRLNLSKEPTNA